MKPEEEARQHIDGLLDGAGWDIQDYKDINLGASLGVAVREFPTDAGPVDYMLFVERKAVGVLEAKPYGMTLSGVAEQTEKYAANVPALPTRDLWGCQVEAIKKPPYQLTSEGLWAAYERLEKAKVRKAGPPEAPDQHRLGHPLCPRAERGPRTVLRHGGATVRRVDWGPAGCRSGVHT